MAPPLILFDYASSPFSQKVHLFCAAAGITIQSCEQSPVLPRPTLQSLEIAYRRIPLLSIGQDIFVDSSLIIDVLQETFGGLPADPAAKAYEVFGSSLFGVALRMVPPALLEPSFVKDRKDVFPILSNPEYSTFRPSALADFRASLAIVERDFLGHGKPWINGDKISLSDIQVAWVVRWAVDGFGLKDDPAFQKEHFPKVFAWLERLPRQESEKLSQEQAIETITRSSRVVPERPVVADDPLGIAVGERVSVETTDSELGSHPQCGRLVSLTIATVAVELENNLRVHFPRRGVLVRKSTRASFL